MAWMQINRFMGAFCFSDKSVIRCEFLREVLIESSVLNDYSEEEVLDLACEECEAIKLKRESGARLIEIEVIDEHRLEYLDT